jgi:hypothetical protein
MAKGILHQDLEEDFLREMRPPKARWTCLRFSYATAHDGRFASWQRRTLQCKSAKSVDENLADIARVGGAEKRWCSALHGLALAVLPWDDSPVDGETRGKMKLRIH